MRIDQLQAICSDIWQTLLALCRPVIMAGLAVLVLSGCAVCRGIDFGHWAGRGERQRLTHVYNLQRTTAPASGQFVLVLAPMGAMQEPYKATFYADIIKEAQQNTPGQVIKLEMNEQVSMYVNEKNLLSMPGLFDFQEVGRVGRLFGASHVVCVWVNRARFNVPQNLDLYFAVVESSQGRVVAEMNGQFDASGQTVSMALNDYLQSCRSREFDRPNLELIEKSPAEYQAFVAHECMKALMALLWKKS